MVFSSFPFIFGFLPVALLGSFVAARLGPKPAGCWLVLASLAFYAYWRLDFLPLLLISIGFNSLIGEVLIRTKQRPGLQQAVFLLGVGGDLAALFYYKYAAALAASLGFATVGGTPLHDIILP